MIVSFNCPCGNTDVNKAEEYDGCLGYEAIICKVCGRIHDNDGVHESEGGDEQYK